MSYLGALALTDRPPRFSAVNFPVSSVPSVSVISVSSQGSSLPTGRAWSVSSTRTSSSADWKAAAFQILVALTDTVPESLLERVPPL